MGGKFIYLIIAGLEILLIYEDMTEVTKTSSQNPRIHVAELIASIFDGNNSCDGVK